MNEQEFINQVFDSLPKERTIKVEALLNQEELIHLMTDCIGGYINNTKKFELFIQILQICPSLEQLNIFLSDSQLSTMPQFTKQLIVQYYVTIVEPNTKPNG